MSNARRNADELDADDLLHLAYYLIANAEHLVDPEDMGDGIYDNCKCGVACVSDGKSHGRDDLDPRDFLENGGEA